MEFKKYNVSLSSGSRLDRELIEALESMPEEYRCLLLRQLLLESFKANKIFAVSPVPAPAAVAIHQPVAQPVPALAPVHQPAPRPAARPAPMPEPEPRDQVIELPELASALDALAEDDEDPMAKLRNILSKTA